MDICSENELHFCRLCDFVTENIINLEEHKETNGSCFKFSCNDCEFKSSLFSNLEEHIGKSHKAEVKIQPSTIIHSNFFFKCPKCDFVGSKMNILERHKSMDTCFSFKCYLCDFKTSLKESLSQHHNDVHPLDKRFKCPNCDFENKRRYLFEEHLKSDMCDKYACNTCDFKTSYQSKINLHLKEHGVGKAAKVKLKEEPQKEKRYQCSECDFGDFFKYNFDIHMKEQNCYKYSCRKCDFKSSYKSKVNLHSKEHAPVKVFLKEEEMEYKFKTDNGKYSCENCDYVVEKRISLKFHKEQKCYKYSCSCCEYKTSLQSKLTSHYIVEHKDIYKPGKTAKKKKRIQKNKEKYHYPRETFKCKNCDYVTNMNINLQHHLANYCFKFKCLHCPFQTSLQNKITKHRNDVHYDILPFRCDECRFGTDHNYLLERHQQRFHNGELYSCNECEFSSLVQNELTRHQKKVHSTMKPSSDTQKYPCHKCEYVFEGKFVMRKHMFSHKIIVEENGFACTDCKLKSHEKLEIEKHVEVHYKALEYMCKICDVKFCRLGTYARHLNDMHNDEKKIIVCPRCQYATKRKDAMKRHVLQVHFRIRHKCDFCPYDNSDKRYMRQHIQKRHSGLFEKSSYYQRKSKPEQDRVYY